MTTLTTKGFKLLPPPKEYVPVYRTDHKNLLHMLIESTGPDA